MASSAASAAAVAALGTETEEQRLSSPPSYGEKLRDMTETDEDLVLTVVKFERDRKPKTLSAKDMISKV